MGLSAKDIKFPIPGTLILLSQTDLHRFTIHCSVAVTFTNKILNRPSFPNNIWHIASEEQAYFITHSCMRKDKPDIAITGEKEPPGRSGIGKIMPAIINIGDYNKT